ncbi:MAG TPA: ABC transporter permease [bacterium]|nr:ABC transporter permease [bacterium]
MAAGGLGRYLARRAAEAGLTLLLTSVPVFAMVAALPGDPAQVILGDRGTPDQLRALRAYLGLDRPLPVQYAEWIARLAHGDLGHSLINDVPVAGIVGRALPLTLQVSAWAFAVVVVIAFPAGVFAATRPRSAGAAALRWYHGWALAVPVFWLGVLLSWYFGVVLRWLPPSGFVPFGDSPVGWARSLVLPGITLGLGIGSVMARVVEACLADVLSNDYVRTARAKGLPGRAVVWRHALGNALIPIVTVLGIQAGFFIGGAVITEAVFAIPGLGSTLWRSILTRDYLVTQSVILVGIAGFVVINLCTDALYGLLDPRVRYQ